MQLKKTPLLKTIASAVKESVKEYVEESSTSKDLKQVKEDVALLKENIQQKNELINRLNKRVAAAESDLAKVTDDLCIILTLLGELNHFLESNSSKKKVTFH